MGKPFKIYGKGLIDPKAIHQMHDAMETPFAVKGALMADAHLGYSLPIGGVVGAKDTVVPAWVGYDIGCGVTTCQTTFDINQIKENVQDIFDSIYNLVPVGFKHQKRPQAIGLLKMAPKSGWLSHTFEKEGGEYQLGTLGGGNHFIEIGYDSQNQIWITVHSGSRGIGHKTASHYMKLAAKSDKPKEGHFGLPQGSTEGQRYLADQLFCRDFARANRRMIIDAVVEAMDRSSIVGNVLENTRIDSTHNCVFMGTKNNLFVHRKGATDATKGTPGVIPGNMKDGCVIIAGKGNPDSLCSCSHGAGRVLSRRQAKKQIDIRSFTNQMVGVKAKVTKSTKDESPMAYKDFMNVLEAQKELLVVTHHIYPLINIKG